MVGIRKIRYLFWLSEKRVGYLIQQNFLQTLFFELFFILICNLIQNLYNLHKNDKR